uniref:Secreted protein n=1 Tax=Mesocestoides corti TaxID=53468 RepID=A0A5K3FEW2_MESCO
MLQPYSLGCGQSPLIDLWLLWLARRLLLLPFHLPQLCNRGNWLHFFPFTDLDVILHIFLDCLIFTAICRIFVIELFAIYLHGIVLIH